MDTLAFDAHRCRCLVTARPAELARVRTAVRSWLGARRVTEAAASDVLIALGEACANVVEHAYGDGPPGKMEVDVARDRSGDVVGRVRDWGTWRAPRAGDGDRASRGRGTTMMRAVTADFRRTTGGHGTVVTFRVRAAGSAGHGRS